MTNETAAVGSSGPRSTLVLWRDAVRRHGGAEASLHALRVIAYRLFLARFDRSFDARVAAETSRDIAARDLDLHGPHGRFATDYIPTRGRLFLQIVGSLGIDPAGFTFIDLGSGKGRTLCLASLMNFRKIIGVELSRELHRAARANVQRMTSQQACRCANIACLHQDAAAFRFPAENCIIYLYNPFGAEVLDKVLANLRRQLPGMGDVYVIYLNPLHRALLDTDPMLTELARPWHLRLAHFVLSASPVAIYRARTTADRDER